MPGVTASTSSPATPGMLTLSVFGKRSSRMPIQFDASWQQLIEFVVQQVPQAADPVGSTGVEFSTSEVCGGA